MTRRQSWFAYSALLVGALTFVSSFTRTTSGQPGAPIPREAGRYRTITSSNGVNTYVFLTDSVTGQTWWYRLGFQDWNNMGSPVPVK